MRRVAAFVLLVFVFTIPWEYSLDFGVPFGNVARVAGVLALLIAVSTLLAAGHMRAPNLLPVLTLCLFLWFTLTALWSIDPATSFDQLRGLFQELMIVWLVWEFVESERDLRLLLRAWLFGNWVLALLTIASFAYGIASHGDQIRYAAAGQDPNDVARYLALGLPLAALLADQDKRQRWRRAAAAYLPAGIVAILLTGSRGGLVAAVAGLIGAAVLLTRHHSRLVARTLYFSPAFFALCWGIVPARTLARLATLGQQQQLGDLNQRVNIWQSGMRAFSDAPWLGHGVGTFVTAAGLSSIDTAHNTTLSLGVETGIVGVALFSAILFVSVIEASALDATVRTGYLFALAVWVISSFVGTTTDSRTTWLLVGVIAAAGRLNGARARAQTAFVGSAYEHPSEAHGSAG